jgi:hypothetical protein
MRMMVMDGNSVSVLALPIIYRHQILPDTLKVLCFDQQFHCSRKSPMPRSVTSMVTKTSRWHVDCDLGAKKCMRENEIDTTSPVPAAGSRAVVFLEK